MIYLEGIAIFFKALSLRQSFTADEINHSQNIGCPPLLESHNNIERVMRELREAI